MFAIILNLIMPQPFRFKQFVVDDTHCAMKVGMDAVLLGAWTKVLKENKILDIGTGTGILALMLAQKSNAYIDAVDIDKDSYMQANSNILNSPWKERIKVYHHSIQDYSELAKEKYDLIISNPPYFINSYKAPHINRHLARHNDLLSQDDIIHSVLKLLKKNGRFCLILPYNEGLKFKSKAENAGLFCNKITYIKPKETKNPHRLLMDFSFYNKKLFENELIIEKENRHQYTEEYKELTKEYYLAF